MYQYHSVQIPQDFFTNHDDMEMAIAKYLNNTLNHYSKLGWTFVRMDTFSIHKPPGCIASLFNSQGQTIFYNVATFRRAKTSSPTTRSPSHNS